MIVKKVNTGEHTSLTTILAIDKVEVMSRTI